jgi:hypothetical protein
MPASGISAFPLAAWSTEAPTEPGAGATATRLPPLETAKAAALAANAPPLPITATLGALAGMLEPPVAKPPPLALVIFGIA